VPTPASQGGIAGNCLGHFAEFTAWTTDCKAGFVKLDPVPYIGSYVWPVVESVIYFFNPLNKVAMPFCQARPYSLAENP
jgi:hypothetical protein